MIPGAFLIYPIAHCRVHVRRRLEAGGLQAFGQLYLDRDNIAGHGLRCDHKMEAKLVKPFPAEGIDMKPIDDPEVVKLLIRNGYSIPEDEP